MYKHMEIFWQDPTFLPFLWKKDENVRNPGRLRIWDAYRLSELKATGEYTDYQLKKKKT